MSKESKRQQRFAGLIQQDLAEIFLREGNNWLPNAMITVTQVRMTPDLSIARVFLSFFNTNDPNQAILSIKNRSNEIRYKLGNKIKNQAKNIPQLDFFIDDSHEYKEHMDKLFDEISKGQRQDE